MSILPSNHEAVFAAFGEYLKNGPLAFADFEPTRDPKDAIAGYFRGLPRRPEVNELTAVGQGRDQSLAVL
ncbi:hypothetical protein GCM10023185_33640 [Hymenobacter saemangeumensis]|uniref:Uncharacterized protein n=1 Tax=Hymenobacter saemangeumensis TaxID=1084522 RepID=A0ABP8INX9_9BACT